MKRKILFLVLVVAALFSAAFLVSAQQQSGLTITGVDDSDFPTIRIFATVIDRDGNFVSGLREPDFEARVSGSGTAVVQVEEIVTGSVNASVVLVIDSSESMVTQPLERTQAAANILLDQLRDGDEVAIVDFDSGFRIAQPFTTDLAAARAAIAAIRAGGVTSLYDAAYAGVEQAVQSARYERRYVVLITDGHEFGGLSARSATAAIELAQANNIPIFAVGFGSVYEPYLRTLGETVPGGGTFILPDSEGVEGILSFISELITGQYIITIAPALEPDGSPAPLTLLSRNFVGAFDYTTPDLYPVPAVDGVPADPIVEPVRISTAGRAPRLLETINIAIDGNPVQQFTRADFGDAITSFEGSVLIDPLQFAPGTYTLNVEAVDQAGASRTTSTTLTIGELPLVFEATGINAGEVINEDAPRTVTATVSQSQTPVQSVTFALNGETISEVTGEPYTVEVPVQELQPGDYVLTATASNQAGQSAVVEVPFSVPAPTPVPTATFTSTALPTATNTSVPPSATLAPTNTVAPTNTSVPPTAVALDCVVTGVTALETISDPARAVSVTNASAATLETVTFAIDGTVIDEDTNEPFVAVFDATALEPGAHTLTVTCVSTEGAEQVVTVNFAISEPLPTALAQFDIATLTPTAIVPTEAAAVATTTAPTAQVPTVAATTPADTAPTEAATLESTTAVSSGTGNLTPTTVIIVDPATGGTATTSAPTDTTVPTDTAAPTDTSAPTDTVAPTDTTAPTASPLPFGFTLTGIGDGDLVEAPSVQVGAEFAEGVEASSVIFALDGTPFLTDRSAPFETLVNLQSLTPGEHTLDVTATSTDGATATESVTFSVPARAQAVEPTAVPPTETPTDAPTNTPEPSATPTPVPLTFGLGGLTAGQQIVDGVITVEAVPDEGVEAASVTFSLDGAEIATDTEAPFTAEVDTANLEPGDHTVTAVMSDGQGQTAEQSVTFNVPNRLQEWLLIPGCLLLLGLLVAAWYVMTQRGRRTA